MRICNPGVPSRSIGVWPAGSPPPRSRAQPASCVPTTKARTKPLRTGRKRTRGPVPREGADEQARGLPGPPGRYAARTASEASRTRVSPLPAGRDSPVALFGHAGHVTLRGHTLHGSCPRLRASSPRPSAGEMMAQRSVSLRRRSRSAWHRPHRGPCWRPGADPRGSRSPSGRCPSGCESRRHGR